jgi:chromosome segregation ATPase
MALVEGTAPERREDESRAEASLRAELESLKRQLGDRNVVASRLEAEIERLEGEAEAGRQKMFDLRQKFEKERKENQKDALESVMRQEAHKTPETWLAERATLTRELEEATRALARAEAKLEEDGAQGDRSERRIKDALARKERAESKARELRVALKKAEARLREEETRIPQMGRRIADLERALDEAERKAKRLREERDRLEQEVQELRLRPPAPPAAPAEAEMRFHPVEDAAASGAEDGNGRETAALRRELERREELIRDLIRELEVLPTIIAEQSGSGGGDVHELVGELERVRGEREELSARLAQLGAQLEQTRARAERADRQSVEAAALVEMVGDALVEGGPAPEPATGGQDTSRMLRDIQEALRRIAGDPRATTVARELGLLWAEIEERRRGL